MSDPTAVKVRAEDGRSISGVDIHAYISNLPFEKDTTRFSTPEASGSTSQAANIIEALEQRSSLLLLDEDTCATNFMVRARTCDCRVRWWFSPDLENTPHDRLVPA